MPYGNSYVHVIPLLVSCTWKYLATLVNKHLAAPLNVILYLAVDSKSRRRRPNPYGRVGAPGFSQAPVVVGRRKEPEVGVGRQVLRQHLVLHLVRPGRKRKWKGSLKRSKVSCFGSPVA
jgi:hypothetical protein